MPDIRRQQKTPAAQINTAKSALQNQHYKAPPNTQQLMVGTTGVEQYRARSRCTLAAEWPGNSGI
jgi:hypothetical protein